MRLLLDGDPASNTLSWHWVAGLHTSGKTYLARPDNIGKYINGRFRVEENLTSEAYVLDAGPLPEPKTLAPPEEPTEGMNLAACRA